jgi:tRNA pseudouridine55 synthase
MLGCGAHLASLRRTAVGRFGLDSAYTLVSLQAMATDERDRCLLPLDALLQSLPQVRLEPAQEIRFVRGQSVLWDGSPQARVRVYGASGALLGVGEAAADGTILPKRVIAAA